MNQPMKLRRAINARSALIFALLAAATALLAACSSAPVANASYQPVSTVSAFSTSALGEPHPLAWQPWIITRFNRRTDYRIVELEGERVLEARSEKAASGIIQELSIDPHEKPILRWRWKVPFLLPGANVARAGVDDSPVRVVVAFDGDLDKLDFEDRAAAQIVKTFSGRDMPYATLMYVWDNELQKGTFLDNAHSGRAKMIIVESGPSRTGQWLTFERNVVEDFKRAFGELPGKITSIGLMTDSNRTETDALAYYGDVALESAQAIKAR